MAGLNIRQAPHRPALFACCMSFQGTVSKLFIHMDWCKQPMSHHFRGVEILSKCEVRGRPQLHLKDRPTLCNNLVLMFERVEYVNINVTGRLKDWIKYAQDAPIWKELIQCLLDPQHKLPARPNWESRDSKQQHRCKQSA